MSRDWCNATPDGVRLTVQVVPNARKTEIVGVVDDALKIRLQAQPIEGRANEALVRFLAAMLQTPRSAVTVLHGATGRRKIVAVAIPSIDPDQLRSRLAAAV